jgi:DEAD/DEAH box helicase domain-containing protein
MDVRGFLRDITRERKYKGQVAEVREIPPREARYARPRRDLPPAIWSLLRRQNIHRLYTHQAQAVDAIGAGEDVVIVTGTASGKTLCYNLPVTAELMKDPSARALYLFPTKALTQDQHGVLRRWVSPAGGEQGSAGAAGWADSAASADVAELAERIHPAIYDGDTPGHNRSRIRGEANLILTNPDMLHVGMLPYHAKWHAFLRGLRYIVIDELHTYRGIFGSHVAGVLRRLLRLCEHYGSRPRIICCSATIANPVELAERLCGRRMKLIDDDGAPRGRKFFVLWNPPFLNEDTSADPDGLEGGGPILRRSANVEAVELLAELVRRRAQTIVFGKARIVVELIYKYATEQLAGESDLAKRIRPYRGGYLPAERREIEQELFSGRLLAVAATNALELGIDVGRLDAAILVGFPGTICSTWQQAGRAGRSSQDSLVVLVGYNEPIDQYLMRHPQYLFGASHERGVIDPWNPHILQGQLACACFEKPLTAEDEAYFGPLARKVVELMAEDGEVRAIDGRYYWARSEFPAKATNLRTISDDTYSIADAAGRVIGNVDSISAPELVYPGAIYLHEAESYLVKKLDMEAKIASVERATVDYYTQPVLASSCRLGEAVERRTFVEGGLFFGPSDVTWQTTAFRKIRYYTMEMIGQGKLDLPSQTLSTTGCWWVPSEGMRNGLTGAGHNAVEALMGARNLMLASLPALAMCDRRDISGMVDSSNLGEPTIFVYDRYIGGLGFSQTGFERMAEWLELCRQMVAECPCDDGCPSCVGLPNLRPPIHHDPDVGGGYPVPNKQATITLLEMVRQKRES